MSLNTFLWPLWRREKETGGHRLPETIELAGSDPLEDAISSKVLFSASFTLQRCEIFWGQRLMCAGRSSGAVWKWKGGEIIFR
jgi:hypothetical protein